MRTHLLAGLPLALLIGLALPACETEGAEEEAPESDMAAMDAAEPQQTPPDTMGSRQAIDAVRERWQSAANADSAAVVAALYTRDARYYSSAGNARGRQAIERMVAENFASGSELEITSEDTQMAGDVAYGTGTWRQMVTTDGEPRAVEGHWLVVLRRQADGTWLIDRHAAVLPMPPATMGAEGTGGAAAAEGAGEEGGAGGAGGS